MKDSLVEKRVVRHVGLARRAVRLYVEQGPITTMPRAYTYDYTSNYPTSFTF